jgi:hypothetical protein
MYSISNYIENSGDSYTIIPVQAALRYHVWLNRVFGIYFYGGVLYNYLQDSSQGTLKNSVYDAALVSLKTIYPSAGTGMFLNIGPGWNLRFNLGFELFSAGLMLRF